MAGERKIQEPSNQAVPIMCGGLDLMSLKITSEEGFLLSRLDGNTNVETLCSSSGLGRKKTLDLLGSLVEKKVVILRDSAQPSGSSVPEKEPEAAPGPEGAKPVLDLKAVKAVLKKEIPKGDELKKLAEAIFVNLENLSYYDLLGLPTKVEGKAVKKAYLRRTKVFHPDRFYRRADREFKRKLQEIFKQINKGFKVLSDEEARKKYNDSLGQAEEVEEVMAETVAAAGVRTRSVKGEKTVWKKQAWAAIRQAHQDKKAKAQTQEDQAGPEEAPEEETEPMAPRAARLKLGLKDKKTTVSPLLRRIVGMEQGGFKETRQQASRLFQGALEEKERGNYKAAKINLRLAIQYDRGNQKYQETLAELEKEEEGQIAQREFKLGIEAQAEGDLKGAVRHFRAAVELGLESPELYHRFAQLVMELENNYERARALCLKAIEMEADNPNYHMTLARAYKGMGQAQAAVIQLEKVLKLEPRNKVAAKELKALKRD